MDLEAPVDAWYVWLAVSLVSVAVAGLVIGLPTGPPPDANRAANAVERVSASPGEASAAAEHDADTVVVDRSTIEMENDHGTTHASIAYGLVVPVNGSGTLEHLARGTDFETAYEADLRDGNTHAVEAFLTDVARANATNSGEPMTATGDLAVRRVAVDPDADELDPLVETVDIEATIIEYGVGPASTSGVRRVTAMYDGVDGTGIALTVDGKYTGTAAGDFAESDDATFADGDGSLAVEISGPIANRPGSPPVTATVEFDDGSSCTRHLDTSDSDATCEHTISRSADLDVDAPYVERDADTGTYYVTLVAV